VKTRVAFVETEGPEGLSGQVGRQVRRDARARRVAAGQRPVGLGREAGAAAHLQQGVLPELGGAHRLALDAEAGAGVFRGEPLQQHVAVLAVADARGAVGGL
jgi:hypothetical protein